MEPNVQSHPSPEIRVGAIWAIVNLCHRTDNRRYSENAQKLRAVGIENKLKEMRDDPSIDVRERVRDALEANFEPDVAGMPGIFVD